MDARTGFERFMIGRVEWGDHQDILSLNLVSRVVHLKVFMIGVKANAILSDETLCLLIYQNVFVVAEDLRPIHERRLFISCLNGAP